MEIAMVSKAQAGKTVFPCRYGGFLHSSTSSVERKLAVVMIVVKDHIFTILEIRRKNNQIFPNFADCAVSDTARYCFIKHFILKDMITFGFRNKFGGWLRAFTAIILGLIMVMNPAGALALVVKVLAAFLIASGIVSLIYGIINRQRGALSLMITNAVVDIAIGVVLFIFPKEVADILLILIGILALVFGIAQLVILISASRVVNSGPGIFVLPVLCMIGGIILLTKPSDSMDVLVLLSGIVVLVYGVSEFVATWKMNRAMKAFESESREGDSAKEEMSGAKDVDYEKVK